MSETWGWVQLTNGTPEITITPRGHSMEPLIMDRQKVTIRGLTETDELHVGDIVLARVKGHVYLHKVTAIQGDRVQISNNHGHINGWTARSKVAGRYDPD